MKIMIIIMMMMMMMMKKKIRTEEMRTMEVIMTVAGLRSIKIMKRCQE